MKIKSIVDWKEDIFNSSLIWAASSEFGTYRLCEQRRFRWACTSAQSRQNLRCSLIKVASPEEPSDRKPDPWPLWMAGHAQLKFVMTECSKTQIRLTRHICKWTHLCSLQLSLEDDLGEKVSLIWLTSPYFELRGNPNIGLKLLPECC